MIPALLERDPHLLEALSTHWQAATNDDVAATLSPLPARAALTEAERVARGARAGAGDAQRSVVEQLESAAI